MAAVVRPFESVLDELARLRSEIDAMEAEWLAKVGEYERSREWQADGYLSAAAALRKRCRMTYGIAAGHVRLARRLEQLPATARAFAVGEISRRHAQVIADAYTPERAAGLAASDPIFAAAARHVDVKDLAGLVGHAVDAIDGDGGAGSDAAQHAQNRFHVSPLGDRIVADGTFDAESGEIVMTALDAMHATLARPGDTRHRSVRHADALIEICRRSLEHDHDQPSARRRGRPQMSVVIDLQALEPDHGELVADIRAEAADVGRLSRSTLERIACDCNISRIVTDGPGQIIDVGRTTRTIPPKLWDALVARDRHCRAPGCDRPPGYCEAHHTVYWSRGGPTNLANLELLCWAHHRKQHQHDAHARRG